MKLPRILMIVLFITILPLATAISTSKPTITVNFTEPVDISSINMQLANDTGALFEVVQIFKNTANTTFEYKPVNNLAEGNYIFSIQARDRWGNLGDLKSVEFTIVLPPLQISLLQPRYGVSDTEVFNVMIGQSRESICQWSRFNVNYENMDPFDTIGTNYSLLNNFDMTGKVLQDFYVWCNDTIRKEMIPAHFELGFDDTPPTILEFSATPNPIIEPPVESTLSVKTDKDTICKYGRDQAVFELMDGKFDGFDEGIFTTTHTKKLNTLLLAQSPYTFYVKCMSKAKLLTQTDDSISISIDLAASLQITNVYTPTFSLSRTVVLNLTTNKNALCNYTQISGITPKTKFTKTGAKQHTEILSNLQEGAHTYYVLCTNNNERATTQISFTVDLSPPIMIYVNNTGPIFNNSAETYYSDRLEGQWLAFDNQSGIAEYRYFVMEGSPTGTVIASGVTTSEDELVSDLQLANNQKYYFKVYAVNNVGLYSVNKTSNGIKVDVSLTPASCSDNKQNSDESDIDCGGSCPSCSNGGNCTTNADCTSKYCNSNNKCVTPTCNDGILNGDETDIDCGGIHCSSCRAGKNCKDNSDCKSNYCNPSTETCSQEENSCKNGVLDPDEADVDCGGICATKCIDDKSCTADTDCLSKKCQNNICCGLVDVNCDGIPDTGELEDWCYDSISNITKRGTCSSSGTSGIDIKIDPHDTWCYDPSLNTLVKGTCSSSGTSGVDIKVGDFDTWCYDKTTNTTTRGSCSSLNIKGIDIKINDADTWCYDPATNTTKRGACTSLGIAGIDIRIGDTDSWCYDPALNMTQRGSCSSLNIQDGIDVKKSNTGVWCYDPVTKTIKQGTCASLGISKGSNINVNSPGDWCYDPITKATKQGTCASLGVSTGLDFSTDDSNSWCYDPALHTVKKGSCSSLGISKGVDIKVIGAGNWCFDLTTNTTKLGTCSSLGVSAGIDFKTDDSDSWCYDPALHTVKKGSCSSLGITDGVDVKTNDIDNTWCYDALKKTLKKGTCSSLGISSGINTKIGGADSWCYDPVTMTTKKGTCSSLGIAGTDIAIKVIDNWCYNPASNTLQQGTCSSLGITGGVDIKVSGAGDWCFDPATMTTKKGTCSSLGITGVDINIGGKTGTVNNNQTKETAKGSNLLNPNSIPGSKILFYVIVFLAIAFMLGGGYLAYTKIAEINKPPKKETKAVPGTSSTPPGKMAFDQLAQQKESKITSHMPIPPVSSRVMTGSLSKEKPKISPEDELFRKKEQLRSDKRTELFEEFVAGKKPVKKEENLEEKREEQKSKVIPAGQKTSQPQLKKEVVTEKITEGTQDIFSKLPKKELDEEKTFAKLEELKPKEFHALEKKKSEPNVFTQLTEIIGKESAEKILSKKSTETFEKLSAIIKEKDLTQKPLSPQIKKDTFDQLSKLVGKEHAEKILSSKPETFEKLNQLIKDQKLAEKLTPKKNAFERLSEMPKVTVEKSEDVFEKQGAVKKKEKK